jgi:hypothetical protein
MTNPSGDQADDPLALFGAESDRSEPAQRATGWAATAKLPPETQPQAPRAPAHHPEPEPPAAAVVEHAIADGRYPTASVLAKIAASIPTPATVASRDLSVEIIGPPPPADSISFDHIYSVKGLGFVEGVALIQETCNAVSAAGPAAGVPELHGLFLTSTGEVVLHGPPTSEPPAREFARLLHQLVAPNLMPPAGRLFVGRWLNSDSPSLSEFASELSYFARPNGQELLVALHRRCGSLRGGIPEVRSQERPKRNKPQRTEPAPEPGAVPRVPALLLWIRSHKPEVTAAMAVVASAVIAAMATILWIPRTVTAAKKPIETVVVQEGPDTATPPSAPAPVPPSAALARAGKTPRAAAAANRPRVTPGPLPRRRAPGGQSPAAIQSQDATQGMPLVASVPMLPSRQAPDLRIYSSSDTDVEPPRLRSAEIPELLIQGFERRTNNVELVISERGEVQQARMIGPPQRMPDIMLLSRAKELAFDPALRNGVAVRYRLVLSWNVTP